MVFIVSAEGQHRNRGDSTVRAAEPPVNIKQVQYSRNRQASATVKVFTSASAGVGDVVGLRDNRTSQSVCTSSDCLKESAAIPGENPSFSKVYLYV